MNTKSIIKLQALMVAALITFILLPTTASSHCDTMNGPVVKAAEKALETGNVNLVLILVQKNDEATIKEAFQKNPTLESLLLDQFFKGEVLASLEGWRQVVSQSALLGIPCPTFSTALAFFDGYRSNQLPVNLLQAQRDFLGAHTYERTDAPRGQFFHTDWSGTGGKVSSSSYNA